VGACPKRGLAYSFASKADIAAVANRISWYYNWATNPTTIESNYKDYGLEYVPMVWGKDQLATAKIPTGSKYLLGFNEPNFIGQSNLDPPTAASKWPAVQTTAYTASSSPKIVSPAVNYCGGSPGCIETDPFVYLDKFFAACTNCQVDHIAVHWYACTADALKWFLNELKTRYKQKIWVTEFSCAQWDKSWQDNQQFQTNYMKDAVAILENEPMVFRYAWFSGRTTEIPYVNLFGADGQLTDLGTQYLNQPCGGTVTAEITEVSAANTNPNGVTSDMSLILGLSITLAISILVILILIITLRRQKKLRRHHLKSTPVL